MVQLPPSPLPELNQTKTPPLFDCPRIPAPRSVKILQAEIMNVDQQYDQCTEAWAKGETDGFFTEGCLAWE